MAESQFPPDDELIDMVAAKGVCPPPMKTDFEAYGVAPEYAHAVRQFQYNIWRVSHAVLTDTTTICTGEWSQILLHLPLPGVEAGPMTRSISDACRWACVLATYLPFLNDYPNPLLWINSLTHKLRDAVANLLKVVPRTHVMLPWFLSSGGVMSLQHERRVGSSIFYASISFIMD